MKFRTYVFKDSHSGRSPCVGVNVLRDHVGKDGKLIPIKVEGFKIDTSDETKRKRYR